MTVVRDRNLEVNQKIVKVHFSNSDIIKSYTTIGLWPSEEKVIDRFFDLGRSSIKNEGLITFKKRWGGLERDLY